VAEVTAPRWSRIALWLYFAAALAIACVIAAGIVWFGRQR